MNTGKAFASCAFSCHSDHVLFLEEDWEVIARPRSLALYRLFEAVESLRKGESDMVHLRHKLWYGAPYYELLTAAQHNEPPPVSLALYFSEDPVADDFPRRFWSPPFEEGGKCDNNRTSWLHALSYQQKQTESSQTSIISTTLNPIDDASASSPFQAEVSLEWCSEKSSILCSSTLAKADPFRNLFYTTNPMLYRRKEWIKYFSSTAGVLGDARAIEESITVSYMWRENPGFRVGFSQGLFRHKRVDRKAYMDMEEREGDFFCHAKTG